MNAVTRVSKRGDPMRRHAATTLVTGLYAITPEEVDTDRLVDRLAAAIAGGARLFQYRSKSPDGAVRRAQAERLLDLCRNAGATLIVNDDLELAMAIGADGVHLGREDGSVAAARERLGEEKLLGVSCYDRIDLARIGVAQGADYVAFGSAFASPTKPNAVHAPTALFAQARAELRVPIVAIGGITPENAPIVIEAGANAVAVITAVFGVEDTVAATAAFCRHFQHRQP